MINWGIIGCGDVTEVKSGPAFNKVPGSKLIAVMRRNAEKAADYALRHNVSKWYANADELINDPDINAIYIATPPSSHEAYTLKAIAAGKAVYVEKPMALNLAAAVQMAEAATAANIKVTVAHYRRQWPMFLKLKLLLKQNAIGEVRLIQLALYKPPLTATELSDEKIVWRVNPAIAGGGLFHDLAPHQLDILYYLFGTAKSIRGMAANQDGLYKADDIVAGIIHFENGVLFTGTWCFTAATACDRCEIIGSNGSLHFSFFNGSNTIIEHSNGKTTLHEFDVLPHVQEPMIAATVNYFSGKAQNPCSADEGTEVMRWMQAMTTS